MKCPALVFVFLLSGVWGAPATISGRLMQDGTETAISGHGAYVVAYVLPAEKKTGALTILGYAHPDETGRWSIKDLPASGRVYVAGFHRDFLASLSHTAITLTGKALQDLGVLRTSTNRPGPDIPDLLKDRQNYEIAGELLRLVSVREGGAAAAGNIGRIEGLWTRSGRVYQIAAGRATVVDAGSTLKTSAAVGDEVMRNIVKTEENIWSAETLWQLQSEKEWSSATLVLSADGYSLTRISTSPWNGVAETVLFIRK